MQSLKLDWQHVVAIIFMAAATVFCLKYNLITETVGATILGGLAGVLVPVSYSLSGIDKNNPSPPV